MRHTTWVLVVAVLACTRAATPARADVVLDWNEVTTAIFTSNESFQNPGYASRSLAMMNLAMYDSLAMTSGRFFPRTFLDYGPSMRRHRRASGEVAAAQAAYTVLSSLYPDQQSILDASLASSLDDYADNRAKRKGIALGKRIGRRIVHARADDGYDSNVQYQPTYEIGHWQPDPVNPGQEAWGPAWGDVDTFTLRSVEPHFPISMPDLTSQQYADSYNEVKLLGSVDSTTRTPEQTEIGLFWAYDRLGMGTPLTLYNNVLRTVAEQEGNSTRENAELFAKASVAMADAAIVAWNSKFEYDFWRPVTGIRDGELDGNPLTQGVTDWTPLGAPDGDDEIGFTPPFPTYLSGHATFGGALFGSLIEFYGRDDIEFSLSSKELEILLNDSDLEAKYGLDLQDAERTFSSFSEAMAENGRSRVYLGIHWDFDDLVARDVGQGIAEAVFSDRFVSADRKWPNWWRQRGFDDFLGAFDDGFDLGFFPPGSGQNIPIIGYVPEPASVIVLSMGILALIAPRRDQR